jgi:shikimate dehydrogenase
LEIQLNILSPPLVHNHWFEKNKVEASYEKKQLEESELKNIAQEIREEKISGINITVPFKQKIIPFLDELSQIAQATNSVNTVYKKNNKIIGDNTDVSGFQTSLLENAEKKQIKSALLIGAGGVSPSIIHSLKDLNVEEIFLTNRTDDKFSVLRNNFGPMLKQVLWKDFPHTKFSVDLVVNATSLGLKEKETLNFNFSKISKKTIFYDVIYNPSQTDFLKKSPQRRPSNSQWFNDVFVPSAVSLPNLEWWQTGYRSRAFELSRKKIK